MDDVKTLLGMLPFLIPVLLLELGLLVFALLDIIKRKQVTGGNKIVWIVIVVLFQVIGPIVYFLAGRKEETVDSDQD